MKRDFFKNADRSTWKKSVPLPDGWKRAAGGKELFAYRETGKIGKAAALKAKCYECCGQYADGRFDCHIDDCPLHPFMPYLGREPKSLSDDD
jgi:hypothetical protein